MAVTYATMYNNMYCGDMNNEQIELLLKIRNLDNIPNLKKMIYNFPYELILESIKQFKRIRDIIADRGENLEDYLGELRPYQTVGTAFMYYSKRSIIADGVGLGKTAEIAALINYIKSRGEMTRFLMAVETSAIGQTQAELTRFTGLNIIALPSQAHVLKRVINKINWREVDGIIIKHSALKSDEFSRFLAVNLNEQGKSRVFNTFILDESSIIKNPKTKTFEYTLNMCNISDRVHFMNATTFETKLMDVYYQLDMMNEGLLPKPWRINEKYCVQTAGTFWTKDKQGKAKQHKKFDVTGYKNQEEFKNSLKLVYFGRSIKDIGMETPSIYKIYEVEPTTSQLMAIENGKRYQEILNCPSLVSDVGIPMNRENVPKLERLCSLIENEFSQESIMVYCFYIEAQKSIYDEMIKMGKKPVILNGSCTDEERYIIQSKFNNGEYDVIITNIKKSLNLNGGNVCIFYSVETNVAKMEQIRGRIDRHVDLKTKTYVLLLYENTPEYEFFVNVVGARAKYARELTIDTKGAADYFMEALENDDEE